MLLLLLKRYVLMPRAFVDTLSLSTFIGMDLMDAGQIEMSVTECQLTFSLQNITNQVLPPWKRYMLIEITEIIEIR